MNANHSTELQESAIASDIIALNFRSFDGTDENELDDIFTQLIEEPEHRNNGTLSGKSPNDLANVIRGGGWVFEGYRGVCIKPDNPRSNAEGKIVKYESPRGTGNQQLFIPKVSVGAGKEIASKHGLEQEYRAHLEYLFLTDLEAEDTGFWKWFQTTDTPIVITEGCKKACSLISNGYPAIALNGVWGWGTNDKDEYGNIERDDRGKSIKTIHPDLEPFLDGRELILAFDRDTNPDTVKMVEAAKSAFLRAIENDGIKVTQLGWRTPKGIDDYIAAIGGKKLDRLYANRKEIKQPTLEKEQRVTSGDTLLEIGRTATYFHTPDKVAYADIPIDGNRHTYAVRSKAFRLWLTGEYFKQAGKGVSAQPLQDSLNTLEAIAIFDGETREVHLRTAEHQGKIYLDLGTADWKAIEVDSRGWRIVSDPPVRFWRPDSLLPLPYPVEGGNLEELRELVNVDDRGWVLLATFLLFCFVPNQTYPVLVISAFRGSGKTAAAEIIKGLIDPSKAPLIKLQGDTLKLAVSATRRLLLVYDNVGSISAEQSDDLCRVATGFGHSTRTLHTTDEETNFEFTRPQIITAIDALVTRDDLADQALMVQLEEITEEKRLPQSELNAKVQAASPRILGALLTALSQTLAELPTVKTDRLPRMADFGKFAIASEKALGLKEGAFLKIFGDSREESRQIVVESSPIGEGIISLMRDRLNWTGTTTELMRALESHTDESVIRSRYYPKTPNLFKRQLNRLKPDLSSLGVSVSEIRKGIESTKVIYLEKVIKTSTVSTGKEEEDFNPFADKLSTPVDEPVDESIVIDRPVDELNEPIDRRSIETPVIDRQETQSQSRVEDLSGDTVDMPVDSRSIKGEVIDRSQTHTPQGFQDLPVDTVDTVDKKSTFSGDNQLKVNGEDSANFSSSSFENIKFAETSPVSTGGIESEVIDCDDF